MGFLTSSMKRLGCMCGKWFWGREDRIVQMDEHEFNRLARDILESLYYFIAIDCDERITFIGKEYAENLGATQEELIGRKVSEVITNTRLPLVLRAGKPELGRFMSVAPGAKRTGTRKREATVSNSPPIYRYGDRERGEMVGVMAEGIIRDFQDTRQLHEEMELLRQQNELYQVHLAQLYQIEAGLNSIIGSSAAVQKLKDVIKRIAKSTITVCISGETGTGKELVANAIHQMSDRAEKPFVKINCAAIPKELLESELFGYEAGAFTGADRRGKMGRFELANHGTLLLDEIGEMPITLQAKLLRVIQEKEVERVGGVRPIPLDVRLICSTNRDLFQMVRNNQFRADLYYRLNTMEIVTPPLRERLEDIPELCELFLKRTNQRNGLAVSGIKPVVYQLFRSYDWPGNVRELEHTLERAAVLLGHGELDVSNFDFLLERIHLQQRNGLKEEEKRDGSLQAKKEAVEKEEILRALEACHGNKSAAAKQLGLNRTVLYSKIKKYGLCPKD